MAAGPAMAVACSLTVTGLTYAATTAGSGAALTYLLIVPSALFGKTLIGGVWPVWRRAVLPFCLATAAMWIIMGSTGHFWPVDGQFLITLFLLGTWLFKVEATAAEAPRVANQPAADAASDNPAHETPCPSPTDSMARSEPVRAGCRLLR